MKTLLTAVALIALPAWGADTARDHKAAWRCQAQSKVLHYYWPAGRKPSRSERARCAEQGGRIKPPTAPRLRLEPPGRERR